MKQGAATVTSMSVKREPITRITTPAAASQIGLAQGIQPKAIDTGRAFSAPVAKCTVHPKGSQR